MEKSKFIKILNEELVKSLGCTEPITITYATALASKLTDQGVVTRVQVSASRNLIKNAMSVNIPGISNNDIQFSSILLAAALGIIKPDIEKNFEILSDLNKLDVENAKELISEGIITLELNDTESKLYLEVIVETTESKARVIIENSHTNITLVEVNGEIIKSKSNTLKRDTADEYWNFLNITNILEFVDTVQTSQLNLIRKSVTINKKICLEGLNNSYGLEVGKNIKENMETEFFSDDITSYAVALTAAGSDARMSGCSLPAMSNSGSGNQGISTIMPVVAVAEKLKKSDEQLIKAVTLSNLITIYIKSRLGRLSSVCGATVSATGACCGITYLLGGQKREIKSAIQIILANITGMICDGAKSGCALKIATCTYAAVQSALLAIKGTVIHPREGFIGDCPEKTIENFSNITNIGMVEADRLILDIMLEKIS